MTRPKSPAFQFYPKDFLADKNVQSMSDSQLGIYIRLLCHCWLEGGIPNDVEELKRFATKDPDEMQKHWKWIAPCFKPSKKDPSKLVHLRLENERKKQKDRSKKMKGAANKRWQKEIGPDAKALQKVCSTSPSTITYTRTPPTPHGGSERFEEFWEPYPKKVGKAAAKRHWERHKLDKLADQIIDAVKRYCATEKWQDSGGKFIPNPLTFLNQERWNDVLAVEITPPQPVNPYAHLEATSGETHEQYLARMAAEDEAWEALKQAGGGQNVIQ